MLWLCVGLYLWGVVDESTCSFHPRIQLQLLGTWDVGQERLDHSRFTCGRRRWSCTSVADEDLQRFALVCHFETLPGPVCVRVQVFGPLDRYHYLNLLCGAVLYSALFLHYWVVSESMLDPFRPASGREVGNLVLGGALGLSLFWFCLREREEERAGFGAFVECMWACLMRKRRLFFVEQVKPCSSTGHGQLWYLSSVVVSSSM